MVVSLSLAKPRKSLLLVFSLFQTKSFEISSIPKPHNTQWARLICVLFVSSGLQTANIILSWLSWIFSYEKAVSIFSNIMVW